MLDEYRFDDKITRLDKAGILYQVLGDVADLSAIIGKLNDQFGMNVTAADRIWFEQQTVLDSDDARVVALNNDYDQFAIMLEKMAESMTVDRYQANGALFDAYFEKPGFKQALLEYLGGAYHEICQADSN